MKHIIKKSLEKLIDNRIQINRVRTYGRNNNPFNLNIQENSFVREPLQIDGPTHIHIGKNTFIDKYARLSAYERFNSQKFSPKIEIGNNVTIGHYSCITAIDLVAIGNGCLFSEYIYISDHSHGYEPDDKIPAEQLLTSKGKVSIGDNTFLGLRSCVLPGVTLGKNCVVGAHAVVTKSFPDYSMIGGIPARLLKVYSFQEKKWI